jgi:hypothetical protein
MVSEIRFPEIPKISISNDFQPYLAAPKAPSKIDKILNNVFESTESEAYKSASFFSKLITTVFSIKRASLPLDAAKEIADTAKEAHYIAQSVGDVLTVVSGAGAVASLISNLKKKHIKKEDRPIRKLEIFRSIMQIITTVTSFLNILDRFKAIELGNITKAMGTIPVIGQGLAQAFPTSVVFSLFSIMGSAATITISALKLKQIKGRVESATAKIKKKWNQPIDENFAERKIKRIITKQNDGVAKADQLKTQIEQMESTLQTKGQNYEEKKEELEKLKGELATANKVSRFMHSFKEKNALKSAKMDYKKEVKKYKRTSNEMEALEKTHKIRAEKGGKWEAIREKFQAGTLTEEDTAALETMRAEKVKKWKSKKINELFAVAKEVSKIALTLISIALAVISIALVIIYTGNVPAAALITMAVIGLSLTAAQLISKLYFNRIKKRDVESVAIPDFRTLVEKT